MSLKSLMEKLKSRGFVTPVTPHKTAGVTVRMAYSLGCTPVTSVPPENDDDGEHAQTCNTQFAANDPEPSINPADWRELAAEYHAHHFDCKLCIAAGRGAQYGLRCGTGSALWTAYQNTNSI